jgi:mannose-6-phosphate isomerase
MPPLVFQPILKRIRWGGRRLGELLAKPIGPESDYAESWEIADHGVDQSVVARGPFSGTPLKSLIQRQNRPLLGRHAGLTQFPLLMKFLDAGDRLSVQVHPDDRLAKEFEPEENGKTEAWVILEKEEDSELYVGLKDGITREDLRRALDERSVPSLLHRFRVRPGDCVFVPAGTVHSIGAGILLAEIQQSSDLTFRLYDWGRVDSEGRPRELHIEEALRCIDFQRGPVNPVAPRPERADHPFETVVRSPYFCLQRHRSSDPFSIPQDETCHVIMSLAGNGQLRSAAETVALPRGQTVLLPAERSKIVIEPAGELVLLDTSLV